MLAGCYATPAVEEPVQFRDVTAEVGLSDFRHENGAFGKAWEPEIIGAGGGFIDYDNDGWMDLLLVGGGSFREAEPIDVPALWLYRNQTDGTFRLVNRETGLSDVRAYGMGVAVADYDNDGDSDFLLTTVYENLLFRNEPAPDGSGRRFVEVGVESGVGLDRAWSTSALFFDADGDGWLDLFIANYLSWSPEIDLACVRRGRLGYCTPEESQGSASQYLRNRGDGTFEDWTHRAGFADAISDRRNKTLGVVEHDFNGDGRPDLYVANDTDRDLLYVNRGDGTFSEEGVQRFVAYSHTGKARAGMGVAAGVVDDTGQTTLFVGNFSRESVGVYRMTDAGYFEERGHQSRLATPTFRTLAFGLLLFDVDLDGDLDLMLANGHVQEYIEEVYPETSFRQPAQLFLNDGKGVFAEVGAESEPFVDRFVGRGAAYADYDRDGDLDVVLTENGGPVRFWRNERRRFDAVRLVLHGASGNRDAYGCVVRGRVGERELTRRISGGGSYLSQSETAVTLGLGTAAQIDSVIVTWPDGSTRALGTLERGQEIHVYQDRGEPTILPLRSPA